jgi:GDP-4-dehydro-6-deoxy-D-mannose reductase
MTPRRILVTGAGGFVAGHLLPTLRAAFPAAELTGWTAEIDIADEEAVRRHLREARPQACVHLAAVSAVPAARRDPGLAWRVNLHGSLALAGAIREMVPDCLLLYVSSAEVYGASFRAGTALDEHAAPAPQNVYAATKAAADLALGACAAEGLKVVRLRPFNHTGPGQSPAFVVAAFARQVARIEAGLQEPVMQTGALQPARDFLDVRDVCAAYVACIRHAETLAPGLVLNVASGTARRIGDILQQLLDLAGARARIETADGLLRPADIPLAWGDAGAARAALGWAPAIAWEQTLRDVLEDWRQRVATETTPARSS